MPQPPSAEFASQFKSVFGFSMEGSEKTTSWLPQFGQLVKFEPGPDRLTIQMGELAEETRVEIVYLMNRQLGWKAGLDFDEKRDYIKLTKEGGRPVAVLDAKTLGQLADNIAQYPEGNHWHLGRDFQKYMQEVWSTILEETALKAFNLDVRKVQENWGGDYCMRFEFKTGEATGEYGLCFGRQGGSFHQVAGYDRLAANLEQTLARTAQSCVAFATPETRPAMDAAFGAAGDQLPVERVPYKDHPESYRLCLPMERAHMMVQAGVQADLAKVVDDHMQRAEAQTRFVFAELNDAASAFIDRFKLSNLFSGIRNTRLEHQEQVLASVRGGPGMVSYSPKSGDPEKRPLGDYRVALILDYLSPSETKALAALTNRIVAKALGVSTYEVTARANHGISFPYTLVDHLLRRKARLDLSPVIEPSLALCRKRIEQTTAAIGQLTDTFGYPFQARYFEPADLFRRPGMDGKLHLTMAGGDVDEQSGKTTATLLKTAGIGMVRVLQAADRHKGEVKVTIPAIHSPDLRDLPRYLSVELKVSSGDQLADLAQRLAPHKAQLRPIIQAAVAAVPIWGAFGESLFGRLDKEDKSYPMMTRLRQGSALDEIEVRLGAIKSQDEQEEHPAKQSVARYLSTLVRHQASLDLQAAAIATAELKTIAGLAPVLGFLVKQQAANGLRLQEARPDVTALEYRVS